MKASSILAVLSMAVCLAAEAGNVCHWTGGANDGKWSSPSNWDTAPISGNGDELVFNTTNGVIVTETASMISTSPRLPLLAPRATA